MNATDTEGSISDTVAGSAAPPDWFLKRRARMEAASRRQLDQSTPATDNPSTKTAEDVNAENVDVGHASGSLVTPEPVASTDIPTAAFDLERSGIDFPAEHVEFEVIKEPTGQARNGSGLNLDLGAAKSGGSRPVAAISIGLPFAPQQELETPVANPGSDFNFGYEPKPRKLKSKPQVVPDEQLSPFQQFRKRWFGPDTIGSFAFSMVIHLSLALLLSVVVFRSQRPQEEAFTTIVLPPEGNPSGDFLDDAVIQIDTSGGQSGDIEKDLFSAKSVAALGPLSGAGMGDGIDLDQIKTGEGSGTGNGIGDGLNLGGFQMPEGGKAVKKGSFTVWTVPNDPSPGEDYRIIIHVKYKKPGQKLRISDISGDVRGTDSYHCVISSKTTEIFPEASQAVLLIPGASARVRDTINVRSEILRESQKLLITF